MLALQALTPERLAAEVPEVTLAEARKLVAQVFRGEPIHASSVVRRSAADAVRSRAWIPTLDVVAESASAIDPFVKYLLSSRDPTDASRERFEAVRIPLEVPGRFSVCVSSQVGCALACAFCATGRMGLRRNLDAWEIVEQVRIVRARLANHRVDRGDTTSERDADQREDRRDADRREASDGDRNDAGRRDADRNDMGRRDARRDNDAPIGRVHGVVFQGMGEPLANLDNVLQAIAVMTDPCALGIDARAITVCTAGLPSGIRRLAREAPNVRLGLSVSSAIAAHRKRVMPIADKHDFDDVIGACEEHARATGHAPMWAVTLLAGVNDSDDDARALAERARAFHAATGKRPRITLLDYNPIGDEVVRDADDPSDVRDADVRDAGASGSVMRDARDARGASGSVVRDARGPGGPSVRDAGASGSVMRDARDAGASGLVRDPFTRSSRLGAFRDVLSAAGLASHRRYSGGSDVAAACGQLAATS